MPQERKRRRSVIGWQNFTPLRPRPPARCATKELGGKIGAGCKSL